MYSEAWTWNRRLWFGIAIALPGRITPPVSAVI
jgi:hypothetical protein